MLDKEVTNFFGSDEIFVIFHFISALHKVLFCPSDAYVVQLVISNGKTPL